MQQEKILHVEGRSVNGTTVSNRLRREGHLPGVVYASGEPAVSVLLDTREFTLTSRGAKASQVFKFKSNNGTLNGLTTLLKSVQHNPLRSEPIHVDFLKISEDHMVTVEVPVELVGECAAVKQNAAFLNQTTYEVVVECFPSKIPDSLSLDITDLTEGSSLNAGQIKMPEGVRLKTPATTSIVSALAPIAEEVAPTPVAADAAATPAAGDAAAAPGAATGDAAAPAAAAKGAPAAKGK